jgi:hypothetical protein
VNPGGKKEMTAAKTINDPGKRGKSTVVSHVINDSTEYFLNYLMRELEPVITNQVNDLEEIEGICGKVYIGLVTIVRANEKIGAETRPEVELEKLVNNIKQGIPVPV